MTTDTVRPVDDAPPAPCGLDPSSWDLDASTVEVLKASVRVCRFECPLLTACRSALAAGAVRPAAMVLAGIAFDTTVTGSTSTIPVPAPAPATNETRAASTIVVAATTGTPDAGNIHHAGQVSGCGPALRLTPPEVLCYETSVL